MVLDPEGMCIVFFVKAIEPCWRSRFEVDLDSKNAGRTGESFQHSKNRNKELLYKP